MISKLDLQQIREHLGFKINLLLPPKSFLQRATVANSFLLSYRMNASLFSYLIVSMLNKKQQLVTILGGSSSNIIVDRD